MGGGGGGGEEMDNSIFQVNVDFAYKYLSLLAYALTHRESDRQTGTERDRHTDRDRETETDGQRDYMTGYKNRNYH